MSNQKSVVFVFLLALILGAQPIATDLYLPAMPELAKDFAGASSTLTFFTLFYGLGQVWGGYWVDRYGRRPALIGALAVYVLAGMVCVGAPSLVWLLLMRSVQGVACSVLVVTVRAAVRDTTSVEAAPQVMSQIYIRLGVVVVLCPLVGAWLVTAWGWRGALAAMPVYAGGLLLWCLWSFRETRPVTTLAASRIQVWDLLKILFASRGFCVWTAVAALTIAGVFTFLTVSSHLLIGGMGLSPYAYGAVLMGGAFTFVCSNFLCAYLLKRHDTVRIARLGAVLSMLGGAVQLLGVWVFPTLAAPIFLGHYVFQLGHGMLQSCAMASSVNDFPHVAGRAAAWSGLLMMVVAFGVSQMAALFVDAAHTHGAWPLALPIVLCSVGLLGLTFGALPAPKVAASKTAARKADKRFG